MNLNNIKLLEQGVNSISKLSIFLFIIAGNYVGDIYSCNLRHLFNDSMILKHSIGFYICLLFVGLAQDELTVGVKILESIFLYIWFIIMMRAPMYITLFTIILLTTMYILNLYSKDLEKEKNIEKKNIIDNINKYIFISSIIISLSGTFIYTLYMKKIFKNKFKIKDFIIGMTDEQCFAKEFDHIRINHMPLKLKKKKGLLSSKT